MIFNDEFEVKQFIDKEMKDFFKNDDYDKNYSKFKEELHKSTSEDSKE